MILSDFYERLGWQAALGDEFLRVAEGDHVGLVLVVLGLSGTDGGVEIVVVEGGIQDGMAVILQMCRLHTARHTVPAVEKKDSRHVSSQSPSVYRSSFSPSGSLATITDFGKVGRFGSRSEPRSHESGSAEVEKLSDYLRISEAAEYLGVSPNTLRNWVNAGKISTLRPSTC